MAGSVSSVLVCATLMLWNATSTAWYATGSNRKGLHGERNDRSRCTTHRVGPAGRRYERTERSWTLVLVRELRHPPEKVWQAITDPAHLREWAPFDADRSLGTAGSHGEAHHGGRAHAARYRNSSDDEPTLRTCSSIAGAAMICGGSSKTLAAARASRCGTTSIAASSQWVLPGGTFVSMFSIAFSAELPSVEWSVRRR